MARETANKILVINVDSDILDFLIKGLQGEVSFSFASDGSKALEVVRLYKPDLILLDVRTSDMNGFEVCRVLKADPESRHIPVVFLTREGDGENTARSLELGAIDYITEPLDPKVVIAKVRNFLEQITASRASESAKESSPSVEEKIPERRTQGEVRPDHIPKPIGKIQGMSLTKFLVIALILATVAGGGYAWYTNQPLRGMKDLGFLFDVVLNAVIQTEPAKQAPAPDEPAKEAEIAEQAILETIEEDYEQPPKETQSDETEDQSEATVIPPPKPAASIDSCDDIPKVPWWGNASHESIIAYVNNKNDGDWDSYISKWERQLSKLRDIHSRGGTGIAPIQGTRLKGPALAAYISQFEKRLDVTRCLADKFAGQ